MLSLLSLLLFLFAASIIVCLVSFTYNACLHPLRKVPGPWLNAASRLPYLYSALTGQLPYRFHHLHETYGPVVRTAPDEVSFIKEEAWKKLYTVKDATTGYVFPKNYDSWMETTNYFMQSIFLAGNGSHKRIRQAFNGAFSARNLIEHEPTIASNVDEFIDSLRRDMVSDSAEAPYALVDLDERFHWLAFDTVSEFVFGESFHCLTSCTYRQWLRKLSTTWIFIVIISSMKQLIVMTAQLLRPTGALQSRVDALNVLDSKSEELLEHPPQRPTLISTGREHMDTGKGGQAAATLSKTEVMANAALFTVAGTDTTATVMPSVMYLLLRHPEVLSRLTAEVRSIPQESDITSPRVCELPLLTACIQEAMRIYPAVPEGLPRVVPEPGHEIMGHWMPPGTAVQVSTYAAYRSPTNFKKPDSFIPERWIQDAPSAPEDREKGVFHPFSTGPRNCIGQSFAMAEMKLAIAKLVWNFDMELCSDKGWINRRCFLLWEKTPLMVRLRLRTRVAT